MVFFFNEKADVIWEVHMSKDTFFTPLPLLGVLEGTSLPITSIHMSYPLLICWQHLQQIAQIWCPMEKEIFPFINFKLIFHLFDQIA